MLSGEVAKKGTKYEVKEFFPEFRNALVQLHVHQNKSAYTKSMLQVLGSENLKTGESLAHILLQFLQTSRHILLKEQLLGPCPPGHQVREVLLFVALNVEKFGEKLLPNFNIPPPLEAPFSLPSVPNLDNIHVSSEEQQIGSCSHPKVVEMLPPSCSFTHLGTRQSVCLYHLCEKNVLWQQPEIDGLAKVYKLESWGQVPLHPVPSRIS